MNTETTEKTVGNKSSLNNAPLESWNGEQQQEQSKGQSLEQKWSDNENSNTKVEEQVELPGGQIVAEVNTKDFGPSQSSQIQSIIGKVSKSSTTTEAQEDIALAREAGVPEASRVVSVVEVQPVPTTTVSKDSSSAELEVSSVSSGNSAAITAATIGKDACIKVVDGIEYIVVPPEPVWQCPYDISQLSNQEASYNSDVFKQEGEELHFNWRVLELAVHPTTETPLLERLKFLCIVSSNLDEYFAKRMLDIKTGDPPLYMTLSEKIHQLCRVQEECLLEDILPALEQCNMRLTRFRDLTWTQQESMCLYYKEKVFPLLVSITVL